jgi:hypothetical protein
MDTPIATQTPTRTGPVSGPLVVAVGLVVGLVVVAVVAVLLVGQGSPRTYPAGSPEAAFQAYLQAYDADDLETAHGAFSTQVRKTWSYETYVRDTTSWGGSSTDPRVWIDSVTTSGDEATLHLTIEWSSGSGIGASRWYDRNVEIRMVSENGGWFIGQRLIGVERYF